MCFSAFEMGTIIKTHKFCQVMRFSPNLRTLTYYKPGLLLTNIPSISLKNQQREFSIQETVESLVKTQTGIFKFLSESTIVGYSQNFLLYLHENSGLPWWATIITSTILLRTTITLPVAIYQQYILAKLENIKLEMPNIAKEVKKEIAIAIKMYNWDERTARVTFNRSVCF